MADSAGVRTACGPGAGPTPGAFPATCAQARALEINPFDGV
jgi:hypothetical protein